MVYGTIFFFQRFGNRQNIAKNMKTHNDHCHGWREGTVETSPEHPAVENSH